MWDPLILKGTASGQEIKEENIKFSGYRNESTPQWSKQKVNKRKAIWDSFMSALGSRRLISHSSFMFIFKIIIKQNFLFIVKECNDSKDLKMFNREDLKHSDGFQWKHRNTTRNFLNNPFLTSYILQGQALYKKAKTAWILDRYNSFTYLSICWSKNNLQLKFTDLLIKFWYRSGCHPKVVLFDLWIENRIAIKIFGFILNISYRNEEIWTTKDCYLNRLKLSAKHSAIFFFKVCSSHLFPWSYQYCYYQVAVSSSLSFF